MSSDWWEHALCNGADPDIWFDRHHLAKQYCRACPVARECLEEVLKLSSQFDTDGIRAGLTPTERKRIRDGKIMEKVSSDL